MSSFGEDTLGRVHAVSLNRPVYRIAAKSSPGSSRVRMRDGSDSLMRPFLSVGTVTDTPICQRCRRRRPSSSASRAKRAISTFGV
jgi:hypothetical protein